MASRNHYYLSIADLAHARGSDPALGWDGAGPGDFAAALEEALRTPRLFERWRARSSRSRTRSIPRWAPPTRRRRCAPRWPTCKSRWTC